MAHSKKTIAALEALNHATATTDTIKRDLDALWEETTQHNPALKLSVEKAKGELHVAGSLLRTFVSIARDPDETATERLDVVGQIRPGTRSLNNAIIKLLNNEQLLPETLFNDGTLLSDRLTAISTRLQENEIDYARVLGIMRDTKEQQLAFPAKKQALLEKDDARRKILATLDQQFTQWVDDYQQKLPEIPQKEELLGELRETLTDLHQIITSATGSPMRREVLENLQTQSELAIFERSKAQNNAMDIAVTAANEFSPRMYRFFKFRMQEEHFPDFDKIRPELNEIIENQAKTLRSTVVELQAGQDKGIGRK